MGTKRKRYTFRQGEIIDVEEFHDGSYGAPGEISTHTPLAGRDRYILCNVQSYIPHLEADKIYKYILSDFCVKFISFFRRTFLRFCNHLMFALMVI